jgi:hypothetical protein
MQCSSRTMWLDRLSDFSRRQATPEGKPGDAGRIVATLLVMFIWSAAGIYLFPVWTLIVLTFMGLWLAMSALERRAKP